MKLSKHTLKILNNLAGFNQNFYASPGNSLRSMTSVKSCVCVTEIEETIDAEISLFSLTDFLDVVNILDDPVLDIQDDFIDLSCNDRRLSYRFFQTDPTALQKVKTMPPSLIATLISSFPKRPVFDSQSRSADEGDARPS